MSITLRALKKLKTIEKVIIHSHDVSLYLVSIIQDGEELYLVDKSGQPIKSHNKLELQSLFEFHDIGEMVLRQDSPYDEMIGQPGEPGTNRLEVSLGNTHLGLGQGKMLQ